jgi:hypothetical protein
LQEVGLWEKNEGLGGAGGWWLSAVGKELSCFIGLAVWFMSSRSSGCQKQSLPFREAEAREREKRQNGLVSRAVRSTVDRNTTLWVTLPCYWPPNMIPMGVSVCLGNNKDIQDIE